MTGSVNERGTSVHTSEEWADIFEGMLEIHGLQYIDVFFY